MLDHTVPDHAMLDRTTLDREPRLTIRSATRDDIALLARLDVEAATPPFGAPFWEGLLKDSGTDVVDFLTAFFAADASNWGNVEDFIVLEVGGAAAGGCAVFLADADPSKAHPLNLDRLGAVADRLGWSNETRASFEAGYRTMWADEDPSLAPQAPAIVETVAVLPEHRGKGLGDALMRAAKDRARELGAAAVGIMVIHGNDAARRLYEKHFEPWATFHPSYFGHEFPGLTKFRAPLT